MMCRRFVVLGLLVWPRRCAILRRFGPRCRHSSRGLGEHRGKTAVSRRAGLRSSRREGGKRRADGGEISCVVLQWASPLRPQELGFASSIPASVWPGSWHRRIERFSVSRLAVARSWREASGRYGSPGQEANDFACLYVRNLIQCNCVHCSNDRSN